MSMFLLILDEQEEITMKAAEFDFYYDFDDDFDDDDLEWKGV